MAASVLIGALLLGGCTIERHGLMIAPGRDAGPLDADVLDTGRVSTLSDDSFADFAAGDLGRSVANLYVRADGTVAPVLSGDANGDGHADVVVPYHLVPGTYDTTSRIYLGLDGAFAPARFIELPTRGAKHPLLADLDGDGFTDVVFANHYSVTAGATWAVPSVVYWGSTAGSFAARPPTNLPTVAAYAVEAVDLDHNGWLDLVFTSYSATFPSTPGVYVYWGRSTGFAPDDRLEIPATEIIDVCPADFDEDGWVDLFLPRRYSHATVSNSTTSQLVRFVDGAPDVPVLFPTFAGSGCAVADLDGDDDLDIVMTQYWGAASEVVPSLVFWNRDGMPSPDEPGELAVTFPGRPTVADFDGDGWLDVFTPRSWRDGTYATMSPIFFGSAVGFGPPADRLPGSDARDADVRDFDGDGYVDVLLGNHSNDARAADVPLELFRGPVRDLVGVAEVSLPGSFSGALLPRDWGHTWDRTPFEHFVSRPLDAGRSVTAERISFAARTPRGTRVRLQLRSAPSLEDLEAAPWTGPPDDAWHAISPSVVARSHAGHRYFQYRAELLFTAAGGPSLDTVTITYR
jgi:hypothetical protein